jgi:uncharacterized protein (DUF2141 family)
MHATRRLFVAAATVAIFAIACGGGGSGSGSGSNGKTTHTISGSITGASSVTVLLSGASSATTTTDGSGNYTFSGLADGSYTVTPSKTGFTFSSASVTVTVSGANVDAQNFSATAVPTHAISGTIAGASSVAVALSGPESATTTTDASGKYSFTGLVDGAYTVTPSKTAFTFSPAKRSANVSGADVTGQDFAATPVTYTISGKVTGAAASVTVALSGAAGTTTTTTDASGNYSFSGLAIGGRYTVAPSMNGYTFNPSSAVVTIAVADVPNQDFAATAVIGATYAISGVVSGAIRDGVLLTLSNAATGEVYSSNGGSYSFSNLANGTYTITPSASGYSFAPPSATLIVNGADVSQNFTATGVPHTISGTITGASSVYVTLSGGPSPQSTTTGPTGTYTFAGVTDGSYTILPVKTGYTFTPPNRLVHVNGANVSGQDFAAAIASFTISGTVSYSGSANGRVFLDAYPSGSGYGGAVAGTSIAGPTGNYTIHGLSPGTYTVSAWMDPIRNGAQNQNDPTGSTGSPVVITSSNATGANIALVDPTPAAPTAPSGLTVFPGTGSALVIWQVSGYPNLETATSYDISYGTDTAASNLGVVGGIAARDDAHYVQSGLTDSDVLYYKIRANVGTTSGSWSAPFGPVTIGAPSGGYTISGTVTYGTTPTGPLYVAIGDPNGQGEFHVRVYASPGATSTSFSVSGVPPGTWGVFAILDQNHDGVIDAGDLKNTSGPPSTLVTVSSTDVSGIAVALSSAKATAVTTTQASQFQGGSTFYGLQTVVNDGARHAVNVTVTSGPNVPVPWDLPNDWQHSGFTSIGSTVPVVGQTYAYSVLYDDGSTGTLSSSVTGVLTSFARNLTATTTGAGSVAQPLFSWSPPSSTPTATPYGYFVQLYGGSADWYYPNSGVPLSSGTTSVVYDVDGSASQANLGSGTYTWSVTVQDANGNQAQEQKQYVVP